MRYFVNMNGWQRDGNTRYREFSNINDARKYAMGLAKKGVGKRNGYYEISILTPYVGRNVGGSVSYHPAEDRFIYRDEGIGKNRLLNKDGSTSQIPPRKRR